MAILKIVGVSAPKSAVTGNGTFKTVKFQEFNERCGILMATGVVGTRNLWSDRFNSDGDVIKGDRLYTLIDSMEYIDGAEITTIKSASPFVDKNGVTRDRTTVVVFKGEDQFAVANREFSSHNTVAIDEDGVVKGDLKKTQERVATSSERRSKLTALLVSKGLVKAEPGKDEGPAPKVEEPVVPVTPAAGS